MYRYDIRDRLYFLRDVLLCYFKTPLHLMWTIRYIHAYKLVTQRPLKLRVVALSWKVIIVVKLRSQITKAANHLKSSLKSYFAPKLMQFHCGSQKVAVPLRHFNPSYYIPLKFPFILCLGHHLRSDLKSYLPNYTPGSPVLKRWANRLLKKLNQSFSLFDQLTKVKILLLIQSG
jgi:hypothetical protein